jgi:sigma-B regulation protein RsbU (phosphoserine phosphatase)
MSPKPSLLLVDDDDLTRDLLGRFLERNGFTVTGVGDGATALTHIHTGGHDLVLLDVLMDDLSGLDVLREIRRRYPATHLPVIMATSRDQTNDIVGALQLGANDYVTKPFNNAVVLARVQTQLSLKRSVDQIRELEQGLLRKNVELEAANRRMKRDLDAAAKMQAALLPSLPPMLAAARFAWEFKPCTELAGDLLNIIPLTAHRVALYILDVMGHGAAAALTAVMVNHSLAQLHLATDRLATPVEVAARLKREYTWAADKDQFFTLLYGVLEVDTGTFRFVTAGHPGPVHLPRDATPIISKLPAYPIGLGDESYEEHSLTLQRGDRLFLYSDGIPDARHTDRGRFGEQRLLEQIEKGRSAPLPESLGLLLGAVQDWCGEVPPDDDISLLAVELT